MRTQRYSLPTLLSVTSLVTWTAGEAIIIMDHNEGVGTMVMTP